MLTILIKTMSNQFFFLIDFFTSSNFIFHKFWVHHFLLTSSAVSWLIRLNISWIFFLSSFCKETECVVWKIISCEDFFKEENHEFSQVENLSDKLKGNSWENGFWLSWKILRFVSLNLCYGKKIDFEVSFPENFNRLHEKYG